MSKQPEKPIPNVSDLKEDESKSKCRRNLNRELDLAAKEFGIKISDKVRTKCRRKKRERSTSSIITRSKKNAQNTSPGRDTKRLRKNEAAKKKDTYKDSQ